MRKQVVALLTIWLMLFWTGCAAAPTAPNDASSSDISQVVSVDSLPESETSSSTQTTTTTSVTAQTKTTTMSRQPSRSATTTTTETMTTTTASTQGEFAVPKITLVGNKDEKNWIYRFGEGGLTVRETVLNSGRGGDAVEIVHITDAHIAFNITERLNWKACLRYAADYDYTVATGDLIEGLHTDLTKFLKNSLDQNPNTMLVLGNHEWNPTKGTPEEMDERYALLQEYWPNDVVYSSAVVKNKVMLIQLDNSQSKFWDSQIPKLQADLKTAREKGYTVLLFYHVPLRTENPEEGQVKALLPNNPKVINTYNFCSSQLRGTENDATGQVYDIITNNADVIKGAFCGHFHEDIYTEIVAKTADGTDAVIPQYINHAARYDNGHVLKITVK